MSYFSLHRFNTVFKNDTLDYDKRYSKNKKRNIPSGIYLEDGWRSYHNK